MPTQRRILFAASLGFFVVIMDTTIVNVALPAIGDDLGGDFGDLQWVVDGYVVAFAALLLSSGALGDRIGVANSYSAGMALFTVASVACALAPSLGVLLGARVVQGMGAALLLPNSLALVRLAYDDPGARAKAIGTWAAVGGIALAAGPVLGGVLTELVDWRAIFFVNVPVGVVAVLATARAPRSPLRETPLDVPGQVAAIVAVGSLTFAVIEAGERGIGDPAAVIAFTVFVVAAGAFLAIERGSAHPAVPFDLFRSPLAATAIVGGLLFNFAFYGQVFVLSLYFQEVLGHSPLVSGLLFLPLTALIGASNVVAGILTSRYGPRPPLILGELLLIAGLLVMLVFDASTSTAVIVVLSVPLGIGGGMSIPPLTAALLEALPPERAGLTSGVFNAARQFGGGLGVAVFGGLIAGGFVSGMHLSLVLGAVGIAATLALTLAYIDPPRARARRVVPAD